jgi:ABC-type bacteriocin/lantibiotic exporter with double-glycine peptidase domain
MRKAALAAAAALAACAGPTRAPEGVRLNVPYFTGGPCGPAAMASVMTFWGEPTDPERLGARRCEERGTLPADLLVAAQGQGLQARSFQATVQDVRDELRLGHPIVAYLKSRFVVVTGFDDSRGGFFVHGDSADGFVPYGRFMERWERTGRWALLLVPAGERSL